MGLGPALWSRIGAFVIIVGIVLLPVRASAATFPLLVASVPEIGPTPTVQVIRSNAVPEPEATRCSINDGPLIAYDEPANVHRGGGARAAVGEGSEYDRSAEDTDRREWRELRVEGPICDSGPCLLAAEAGASRFTTVLAEDGAKIVEVSTKGGARLEVAFEEVWEGNTLTLKGTHVQGASPGQVGPKELLNLAREYGREQGAGRIIVQGATRTTSSMAGRTPRPWVLDVGE